MLTECVWCARHCPSTLRNWGHLQEKRYRSRMEEEKKCSQAPGSHRRGPMGNRIGSGRDCSHLRGPASPSRQLLLSNWWWDSLGDHLIFCFFWERIKIWNSPILKCWQAIKSFQKYHVDQQLKNCLRTYLVWTELFKPWHR